MSLRDLLRPSAFTETTARPLINTVPAAKVPQKPVVNTVSSINGPQSSNKVTLPQSSYQVNKLKLDVQQASKKVLIMQGQRDLLNRQRDNAIVRRATAEETLSLNDKVQILLQKTSDFSRQQAKNRIEEIVTSALSVVFGKDYKFRLTLEVRSNRPEADYWLESEGIITQLKPPDYDRGGGVIDVITLALRLAIGELSRVQGPIFMDETTKHVSAEFAANIAYFLKEYSQKFGRQIILITHNEKLAEIGDVNLGVSQENGFSRVKVL